MADLDFSRVATRQCRGLAETRRGCPAAAPLALCLRPVRVQWHSRPICKKMHNVDVALLHSGLTPLQSIEHRCSQRQLHVQQAYRALDSCTLQWRWLQEYRVASRLTIEVAAARMTRIHDGAHLSKVASI